MAITLDELLGMNTSKTQNEETIEKFPSYEDYFAGKGRPQQRTTMQDRQYNYTVMQAGAPRSTETMRAYEASRPYQAPRNSEYINRDYGYEQMTMRSQAASQARTYNYSNEQAIDSFHDFSRQDVDRPSEQELFDRLAGSTMPHPASRVDDANTYERTSTFTPAKKTYKSESTKKARLNTKAKVLLAVYFAIIILVAVLIIVNAGNLNNGTATTPSSSITSVVSESVQNSNISFAESIEFDYGTTFNIK